ncbi:hypothetical protein FACS1894187_14690 [Synergistales bacterium]|nr:hypothetical protein FACS1894187_14690 [Synergistales bacterium]
MAKVRFDRVSEQIRAKKRIANAQLTVPEVKKTPEEIAEEAAKAKEAFERAEAERKISNL